MTQQQFTLDVTEGATASSSGDAGGSASGTGRSR